MPRWLVILLACGCLTAIPARAAGPRARVERSDGSMTEGSLVAIDANDVRLQAVSGDTTLPVTAIRRVVVVNEAAVKRRLAPVTVTTTTGSQISGDEFTWTGDVAAVIRGEERIELPIGLVQLVAWRRPEDADGDPAWITAVPEQPESDLVIVGGGPEAECVACAITAVSAESVTVVLEGETIPVKRTRVAGLRWLRPPAAPQGRIGVATAAGRFAAASVTLSPADGLVLDGRVRMPVAWLESIDYAADRTVRLAELDAERMDVEPFFGGLRGVEGLAGFFAPRVVKAPAGESSALLLRPRTVGVWRVPTDSRRFLGTICAAGAAAPRAEVVIDIDGREVFRGTVTTAAPAPAGLPIDLDVAGGRRLTLTIDFADGGPGGPLRLDDARFEK
ncbi:MAG: hypothetical protein WCC69_11845 [Pirellulales bacterium]